MTEEKETKTAPFDAELEIIKLQGRFRWVVSEMTELQQKDRSLSARISRLKLAFREGQPYDEEGGEEGAPREEGREALDDLTIEQRALLMSELLDRIEGDRPS